MVCPLTQAWRLVGRFCTNTWKLTFTPLRFRILIQSTIFFQSYDTSLQTRHSALTGPFHATKRKLMFGDESIIWHTLLQAIRLQNASLLSAQSWAEPYIEAPWITAPFCSTSKSLRPRLPGWKGFTSFESTHRQPEYKVFGHKFLSAPAFFPTRLQIGGLFMQLFPACRTLHRDHVKANVCSYLNLKWWFLCHVHRFLNNFLTYLTFSPPFISSTIYMGSVLNQSAILCIINMCFNQRLRTYVISVVLLLSQGPFCYQFKAFVHIDARWWDT